MTKNQFELAVLKSFDSWQTKYKITPDFINNSVNSIFQQFTDGIATSLSSNDPFVYANCWTIELVSEFGSAPGIRDYASRPNKETIFTFFVLPIVEDKLKEFDIKYEVYMNKNSLNIKISLEELKKFCKLDSRYKLAVMK